LSLAQLFCQESHEYHLTNSHDTRDIGKSETDFLRPPTKARRRPEWKNRLEHRHRERDQKSDEYHLRHTRITQHMTKSLQLIHLVRMIFGVLRAFCRRQTFLEGK